MIADATTQALESPSINKPHQQQHQQGNPPNPVVSFIKNKFEKKNSNSSKTTFAQDDSLSTMRTDDQQQRHYSDDDAFSMQQSMFEEHLPDVQTSRPAAKNKEKNPFINFFKKFDSNNNLPEKQEREAESDQYDYYDQSSPLPVKNKINADNGDDISVFSSKSAQVPLEVGFPQGNKRRVSRSKSPVPQFLMSRDTQESRLSYEDLTIFSTQSSPAAHAAANSKKSQNIPEDDDMESLLTATRYQLAAVQAELDRALHKLDKAEKERDWLRNKYSALQFEQASRDEGMSLSGKESYIPRQVSTHFDPVTNSYR